MNEAVYTVQAIDKEIAKQNWVLFTQPLIDDLKSRKEIIVQEQGNRINPRGFQTKMLECFRI